MSFNRRQLTASVGAALTVLLLSACSAKILRQEPTPPTTRVTNPPPGQPLPPSTPADEDVVIRKILKGYLDALDRGAYAEAAGYWSPASSVTPPSGETLKGPGLSNWHFQSSEMIELKADSAYLQLNFDVKVAAGAPTGYNDGKNVRYVRLTKENGAWKIASMATAP